MAQFMESLPIEEQKRLESLPDDEMERQVEEMMAQMPQQPQMAQQDMVASENLNQAIGGIVE